MTAKKYSFFSLKKSEFIISGFMTVGICVLIVSIFYGAAGYEAQTISSSNKKIIASNYIGGGEDLDNTVAAAGEGSNLGASMISARSSSTYSHSAAVKYCRNLSASPQYVYEGGSDSTVYKDWRMPNLEELVIFAGMTSDTSYLWTTTVRKTIPSQWISTTLQALTWVGNDVTTGFYVRCVR